MPRDDVNGRSEHDERTLMPKWYQHEKHLAHMLPYVSLVDDRTVRTRVNELFQCIRITGVNSYTTDDDYLDKVRALFARIVAQLGEEFSFYVHKVSKGIKVDLEPIDGDSFAALVDAQWREKMETSGLRDKTLTLTVIHRPPSKGFLSFMRGPSPARLKDETVKRLRRLNEAVGIFTSGLANLKPSILSAESGELVGFLGALNTGQERPLYHTSKFGFLSSSAANTRVTFHGDYFELSEGVAGRRYGKSYSIKDYSEQTSCTMFDTLNLPV
ncbi:MAG: type IV secretion system protein B4, partial [Pseudomonadota bacterium]